MQFLGVEASMKKHNENKKQKIVSSAHNVIKKNQSLLILPAQSYLQALLYNSQKDRV